MTSLLIALSLIIPPQATKTPPGDRLDLGDGALLIQKGQFLALGFAGAEAADHMRHLKRIAEIWQRLPQDFAGPGLKR